MGERYAASRPSPRKAPQPVPALSVLPSPVYRADIHTFSQNALNENPQVCADIFAHGPVYSHILANRQHQFLGDFLSVSSPITAISGSDEVVKVSHAEPKESKGIETATPVRVFINKEQFFDGIDLSCGNSASAVIRKWRSGSKTAKVESYPGTTSSIIRKSR